ncbi:MAG TPA: BrnT family toxin [Geobacter sp.]|nr:BrnT family toxin [Geobacter sp.]
MVEWDEAKRHKNLEKHSLDFRDARLLFDGRNVVHVPAFKNEEARFASVAMIDGRFYTVIWTWRGNHRRIISFRRARNAEEGAYRQIHG